MDFQVTISGGADTIDKNAAKNLVFAENKIRQEEIDRVAAANAQITIDNGELVSGDPGFVEQIPDPPAVYPVSTLSELSDAYEDLLSVQIRSIHERHRAREAQESARRNDWKTKWASATDEQREAAIVALNS